MEVRSISSTLSSSGRQSEKLQFRVAYVGYGEEDDEWIDHDDDKLAQFDTMSKGRRGDQPVREEILCFSWKGFLSKHVVPAAIASDYSFSVKPIVRLVNVFASNNGFARLFAILTHCVKNRSLASLEKILPLATMVANLGRIYSKEFVDNYARQFFSDVKSLLLEMTPNDIRHTSMEVIENTLAALENFAYLYFGRNEIGGEYIEGTRLTLAIQLMSSQVLSKRLGGLKMLNELIRRASSSKLYPSGINRMELPSVDANNPDNVIIKYHIVPVNFNIFHGFICTFLRQADYMSILYTGNDIHESLIDRSSLVLAAFAEEDLIQEGELKVLIKSGVEETPSILQALKEIGQVLSSKKQMAVLKFMESFEGKRVNESLVEFVNSLALGTRKKLMSDFISSNDTTISSNFASASAVGSATSANTSTSNDLIFLTEVHQKSLSLLWTWSSEESGVPSQSIRKSCVERLEKMLEIGVPMNIALENPAFPWSIHWMRVSNLISDAVRSISLLQSLVPALKVIQQFIYSWPANPIKTQEASCLSLPTLPFRPSRIAATEYLVNKFSLYTIISNAVENLKSRFDMAFSLVFSPGNASMSRQQSNSNMKSPPNKHVAYLGEIELLLEMVYLVYRSCEKRFYPKEQISALFRLLVSRAKIVEEFDFMINVMVKIPTKPGGQSNASATPSDSLSVEENAGFNFYQYGKESYLDTFRALLCDDGNGTTNSYLSSNFFSIKTLKCLEKWFRWINIETTSTTTSATSVLKVDNKDGKITSVTIDPNDLIGVKVFVRLVFCAHHDQVASSAVAFLSNLIKVTSPNNKAQAFRQELLNTCFQHLDMYQHQSEQDTKKLGRVLMLLDGLIEESFASMVEPTSTALFKLYPHSSLSQGSMVTFKISSTSRNIRNQLVQNNGEIVIRMHETVETLFQKVGNFVKLSPQDIKIFRLGKEISSLEFHKSVSTLPNISEKESLVVVERPSSISPPSSNSSGNKDTAVASSSSSTRGGIMGSNPSLPIAVKVASDKIKFELFFQLMSATSDSDAIDALWNTLLQLPTSQYWLMKWMLLDTDDVQHLFNFVLTKDNSSRLCEVLYALQIIEAFLHPIIPVSELLNQYSANNAPGGALFGNLLDEDWAYKFLYKHGIPFLSNTFAWITMIVRTYRENSASQQVMCGLSINILSQAFRLISKLMRAFILRLVIAKHDDENEAAEKIIGTGRVSKSQKILTLLSNVRETYETDAISPSLRKGNLTPPPPPVPNANSMAVSETVRSRASSNAPSIPSSPRETSNISSAPLYSNKDQFLNDEWGSKVNYNSFSREGIMLLCDNCATERLYWTYILSMITLSELHADQLLPKSGSLTESIPQISKSKSPISDNAAHIPNASSTRVADSRTYQSTIVDLFLIWSCLGIIKPALLSKQSFSSTFGFKNKLDLTYEKVLAIGLYNNAATIANGSYSPFHYWFPTVFGNFLLWTTNYFQSDNQGQGNVASHRNSVGSVSSSNSATSSTAGGIIGTAALRSHIINIILTNRPSSAVITANTSTGSTAGAKYATSVIERKDALFILASMLLTAEPDTMSVVNVEQWKSTCVGILDELKNITSTYQSSTGYSYYNRVLIRCVQNLEGNMKLLSILTTKVEEKYFLSIYDRACTNFILQQVLGFLEVNDPHACSRLLIDYEISAKKSAFAILKAICDRAPQLAVKVYQNVKEVHRSLPVPSLWDLVPDKESKQLSAHANSVASGFVGVKNLGSTCYMNALLQALYMLSDVRDYLLYQLSLDYIEQQEDLRNDVAYQLQKVFTYLTYSDKKSFSPDDWVFAFKDESGVNPMDVRLQQDAQEFFAMLCDRFQSTIQMHCTNMVRLGLFNATSSTEVVGTPSRGSSASSPPKPQDIFRHAFGGKLSNPMYVSPENNQTLQECIQKHGIREPREEEFFCISVNVKNLNSLEESLQQFVTGEKISDFTWEENQPKTTIVKRQCLSEISNSIIFHLKRFELNFDTFRKEKINDSFTFPLKLNMKAYMKEGLPEFQYLSTANKSANGSNPAPTAPVFDRPSAYYEYELTGVIVHTGSGESGHYYSFCKDTTTLNSGGDSSLPSWYEFNDSEVTPFDISKLSQECFGGTTSFHDFNVKTQSFSTTEVMSTKNAYMLIYTRVNKLPMSILPGSSSEQGSTVSPPQNSSTSQQVALNKPKSLLVLTTIKQIEQENMQQALTTRVLSSDYFQFYCNLLKCIFNEPLANSQQKRNIAYGMALESYRFLLKFIAKTCFYQDFAVIHKVLADFVASYDHEQKEKLLRQQQELASSLVFPNLAQYGGGTGGGSGPGSANGSQNGGNAARSVEENNPSGPGQTNNTHQARISTNALSSNSMGSGSGTLPQAPQNGQGSSAPTPPPLPLPLSVGGGNTSIGIAQPSPRNGSREFGNNYHQPPHSSLRQKSPSPVAFPPLIPTGHGHNTNLPPMLPSTGLTSQLTPQQAPPAGRHSRANSYGSNQGQLIANMMISVDQLGEHNEAYNPAFASSGGSNPGGNSQSSRPSVGGTPGGSLTANATTPAGTKSLSKRTPSMSSMSSLNDQIYLSKGVLHELCFQYTEMVLNNIFAPKDILRQEMSMLFSFLVTQAWFYEQPNIKTLDVLSLKLGSFSAQRNVSNGAGSTSSAVSVVGNSDGDDADFALALKLSQQPVSSNLNHVNLVGNGESKNSQEDQANAAATAAITTMLQSLDSISIRFIVELTMDTNMQLLVEYWRKNNAMITVLLKFAQLGYDQRWILIQRDVIASAIDMILGDQSPLNGKLYPAHGRKRCPSSAIIVPFVKDPSSTFYLKSISATNYTIPNWCELLELLVLLVTQCVINRPDNSAILPDALGFEVTSPTRMSIWDMTCLTCKPLYATLIKQSRYIPYMCKLITYLALDNPLFSSMIAEVIWDEMSMATIDTVYNAFEVLTAFLQIKDSLKSDRFFTFFGWNPLMNPNGPGGPTLNANNTMNVHVMNSSRNLLTMMSHMRNQPIKSLVLIVFIRSFLGLVDVFAGLPSIPSNGVVPSSASSAVSLSSASVLTDMLANPKPHVLSWAGWMLQFLTQQVTMLKSQPSAPANGPFLVIFGESELDRELSWSVRADRTYQFLTALLVKWDLQPLQVLQQYVQLQSAVNQVPVSPPVTSRSSAVTPVNVNQNITKANPVVTELKDGMTDEELARFLAGME